jgi:nucleoside-diphosphate-sugar epimerase
VIAVTGATGFIGRHLIETLGARGGAAVRVLVRNRDAIARAGFRGVAMEGDMRNPTAFARILEEGCTWVNMAHLDMPSETDQINVMASLLEVCRKKRIRRLVHCSTAVVAGRSNASVVTESTDCLPGDRYEVAKLAIEQVLLQKCGESLEVVILRPTAVFGPRGRNLIKLANDLRGLPSFVNYLKSCLQGSRRMNLVHVDNVVAALAFLIDAPGRMAGEVFIVSDDEAPGNNFRNVERCLMAGLGIPEYPVAPAPLPRWMLSAALRAAGRTNSNPSRIYDCSKIVARGLKKPVAFEKGLADFTTWYRDRHLDRSGS